MASVLETFFILFESDASDAKKENDNLNKSLDETEDAASSATGSVDETGEAFLGLGNSALGAIGGILALGSMVAGVIGKTAELDQLGKFSDLIGENIGAVDAWSQSAIRAGGTAQGFQSSIESLNEKMVDASIKGTNEITPFFNQLGISIVDVNGKAKKSLEILPELAGAFEGLDKQESAGLGKKLGLDQGTIMLLQSGRAEVEAMVDRQTKLGVATREAADLSAKFNDQMADLKQTLSFSSQSILVSVLPALTWMLEGLTDVSQWMGENQVLVEGFFIGIGLAALKFVIPPMITMATAVWAAVAPFLAIGVAIATVGAAIALIYEDIVAFNSGQDSLIGSMIEKWPILGDIIKGVGDTIKTVIDGLSSLAEFMFDLFTKPEKALEKLKSMAGGVVGFFGFGDDSSDEEIKKTTEEDKSDNGFLPGRDMIKKAQQSIIVASAAPITAQTSSSIQNSTSSNSRSITVQTGDTVIQTQATDPEGIARNFTQELESQLNTAIDNFDDGIDR